MSSLLKDNSVLSGFSRDWEGVTVQEMTDYELISLAVVSGEEKAFKRRYKAILDSPLPAPGQVLPAKGGSSMWLEPGKYLIMLGTRDDRIDETLKTQFKGSAYGVLLSDGWACLQISGEHVFDVFERFISLDMPTRPKDFATRTSAHHIAVIVVTLLDGTYLLLTPRSLSRSFLDALIQTIDNIIFAS